MTVALARVESWMDHVEAWHHFGREVDGAAWSRAAIAASVKGKYGDDALGKFAEEVGFSPASVKHFAYTFEAFPENGDRSPNLTFSHHLHAAVRTKTAVAAKAAVALAEREGWSANALRAHLSPPSLPEPAACGAEAGTCGPATVDDKIFHISAMVDSFYSVREYEIGPLVRVGSKKSLKELSRKIKDAVKWLEALEQAIKERTQ